MNLLSMTCYETWTTVISALSLVATIFFGSSVFWLSKKSNEIAKDANKIQEMLIKKEVSESSDKIQKDNLAQNFENIDEINKFEKEMEKIINKIINKKK